jgi:uncharacterized protein involved in exopolysaccharide biosynthesis
MNNTADNEMQQRIQLMKFEDYFAILKRRKVAMIIPFLLILTAAILLAFLLPSIYRSEATILTERQEIPKELVDTTVTGFVQERIESLSQLLLTRETLWEIANKFDLYADTRTTDSRLEITSMMRESIEVRMLDVRTSEPDSYKEGLATIAFTVAYEAEDPYQAQAVTNELASLFIVENKRLRSKHAEEVSGFLKAEGDRLNKQITELESQLAEFKQAQQSQLPEHMDLNMELFEKTGYDIERTNERIRELEDRIIALQAEISITKPNQDIFTDAGNKVLTGNERLSLLTADYLRLSARYSAKHPDLIKLRREIDALGGESDVSGVTALIEKLTVLKDRLSKAKQQYSADHPDVLSLQRAVAGVERGLQTASVSSNRSTRVSSAPDNPRYVSLKTQLDAAAGNLKSERAKLIQLNKKSLEYEARLFQTPAVERDYKFLTRDYENARKKYNEIRNKQLEARLAIDLESSDKGQQFSIIQGAYLPELPERPNRVGIVLLGFLLAGGAAVGVGTIREYMDRTIYDARDLISVFRAPPLATIPFISN